MNLGFDPTSYTSILDRLKDSGYSVVPMRECEQVSSPALILRHDVDMSLHCSLAMAELEAAHGISSTYFILLYNDFYNPLSPAGRKLVSRIRELGLL